MKSLKGVVFAVLSSGTFGLIPLFSIPLLATGLNTPSILFYRFLFSTILMGLICLIRKESFKINRKHLLSIFTLSLLYAATAVFLLHSYNYIPSGIATSIHFMYPILVSAIMVFFFKERKSVILLLAAVLSVIGVVFMSWTGGENIQFTGIVIASITVVTYATYIVGLNQSKAGKLNAEILTFYILLFGAIIFLVLALCTTGIAAIPSTDAFIRLALLAFLCTVVSDLTLILAVKCVGSTITSILGSMEPIVAVLVGILYFSEDFTKYSIFGILLIIISVAVVVAKKSKPNGESVAVADAAKQKEV